MDHAFALTGSPSVALWPMVRSRLHALCGIVLGEDQSYLLTRLEPVARDLGFKSVGEYLAATLAGGRSDLEAALVETMTTHESSFFRDSLFWETLRKKIAPMLANLGRPIQIWSAACSSGQEPYSLAILLRSEFPALPFEIWATDVAEETLARARTGHFSSIEVERGLPPAVRNAYFDVVPGGFRAIDKLRAPIRFDTYNLLGTAHPLRRFDIVCCRNVLVYFDDPSRERVMRRLADSLTPEGWLGLGSTELPVRDTVGLTRMPSGGGWLERAP